MASSKDNPFSSKWFVFEEPPVANHQERVRFRELARTKVIPSPNPPNPPNRTAAPSQNTKVRAQSVRWFTVDRFLRIAAVVLIILIAAPSFKPLHTSHVVAWLQDVLEILQPYFPISPGIDTTRLTIRRHAQQYLEEHVEEYVEECVELYVNDNMEHLVQAIVQRYVEDNIERCIEPYLAQRIEHVEQVLFRSTRAILRQQVTGRRDYAFQADGGRIVSKLTTGEVTKSRNGNDNRPEVILRSNLDGGHCWVVQGSRAQVGISVARLIFPSHITVDHVPAEATDNFQQAPRHMRLWGSVDGQPNVDRYKAYLALHRHHTTPPPDSPPMTNNYNFVHLADFEYDVNATSHIQTFPVYDYVPRLGMDFGVFVVEVLDNWGGDSTCLYRIRLHGYPSSKDE